MLRQFVEAAYAGDPMAAVRADLIGEDVFIDGPVGSQRLLYADYAASGRALKSIEAFILENVLPYYANAHTEASYCGAYINRLRAEARGEIARLCNAGDDYSVIFAGSGATAGLNRLAHLLTHGASEPLVVLGPYEHHSNLLPWRESGAELIQIGEAEAGGPDCEALTEILRSQPVGRKVIGAFSAASNVTGILTDIERVNGILKHYDAISVWDFAAAAPYVRIDMEAGGGLDAIVLSPHKCVGGPAASGVLIIKTALARVQAPSITGGGTVSFVSPWTHHYVEDLSAREEAGTPNVIGDIRAALALLIKEQMGEARIEARNRALVATARRRLECEDRIELLGHAGAERLPIFSFRVRDGEGAYVHHQLVTRMLSDYYGVQARGGCACAGPYAHDLLHITKAQSEALWTRLEQGHELEKPGWVRINLCPVADEDAINAILEALADVSRRASALARHYACDETRARFQHM